MRALALRTMSSLQLPVIGQIVALGIKRGLGDMSAHVRRAAALAIPKCYRLDPATLPALEDAIAQLLMDKSYYVAGAAVVAWSEICPTRLDMINPAFRGLCRKLVDMDEWSQVAVLRMMTFYCRKSFVRKYSAGRRKGKDFYDEDEPSTKDTSIGQSITTSDEDLILDPDHTLLLNAARPLLTSRNTAVILAVTRLYTMCGTNAYLAEAIGPLISLVRREPATQLIALHNIVLIALTHAQMFAPYTNHFLVKASDGAEIGALKIEMLTLLFPHTSNTIKALILAELEHFSRSRGAGPTHEALVRHAVRAIGRCAQTSDDATSARCLRLLLSHLSSPSPYLVAESLEVIRHLIQRSPTEHTGTIIRLAKNLDTLTSPTARASIIWLAGESITWQSDNNVAADVLRLLVRSFSDEDDRVKSQIVLLAAKVYVGWLNEQDKTGFDEASLSTERIPQLWNHILLLSRYDVSYDLRDRTRLYRSLLAVPSSTELATLLLLAPKPVPMLPSPSAGKQKYLIGSASLVVGEEINGYEELPPWVEAGKQPDPRLRDEDGRPDESRILPAAAMLDAAVGKEPERSFAKPKEKTLDDWLAEDDDDEDDEEEDDEEEEESEDEEESEEEESEEEESEEETPEDEKRRLVG